MGDNTIKHLQADPMAAQGIPKTAATRVGLADKLLHELLLTNGCLATVVQLYGPPTLIDLMYLQGAVTRGTYIEVSSDQSALLECLGELPSASIWLTYVDVVVPE